MKTIFLLFVLSVATCGMYAQHSITGIVKDKVKIQKNSRRYIRQYQSYGLRLSMIMLSDVYDKAAMAEPIRLALSIW
ncbi:MAG: hypothetical protein LBH58_09600 [Tannerellaceae bacterium]|nr:hypothetical protein [Tannerellaceae bacterium]